MASPTTPKSPDQKSLHEDEDSRASSDPLLVIYQNIASKDAEWKARHTTQLLRRVDIRLLPLLILMYLLNFLDRSNLAQARLGTLEEDLGMKGTDFNLATSILFVVCFRSALVMGTWLTAVNKGIYYHAVASEFVTH